MGTGTGWNRLGPANRVGEARGPHTGSVRTRQPSISSKTVECPSQVARSPLCAARVQVSRGLTVGSGADGTRLSPPHRKSLSVGMGTLPSGDACVFRKRWPSQRGEAAMRSRRDSREAAAAFMIPSYKRHKAACILHWGDRHAGGDEDSASLALAWLGRRRFSLNLNGPGIDYRHPFVNSGK